MWAIFVQVREVRSNNHSIEKLDAAVHNSLVENEQNHQEAS